MVFSPPLSPPPPLPGPFLPPTPPPAAPRWSPPVTHPKFATLFLQRGVAVKQILDQGVPAASTTAPAPASDACAADARTAGGRVLGRGPASLVVGKGEGHPAARTTVDGVRQSGPCTRSAGPGSHTVGCAGSPPCHVRHHPNHQGIFTRLDWEGRGGEVVTIHRGARRVNASAASGRQTRQHHHGDPGRAWHQHRAAGLASTSRIEPLQMLPQYRSRRPHNHCRSRSWPRSPDVRPS